MKVEKNRQKHFPLVGCARVLPLHDGTFFLWSKEVSPRFISGDYAVGKAISIVDVALKIDHASTHPLILLFTAKWQRYPLCADFSIMQMMELPPSETVYSTPSPCDHRLPKCVSGISINHSKINVDAWNFLSPKKTYDPALFFLDALILWHQLIKIFKICITHQLNKITSAIL